MRPSIFSRRDFLYSSLGSLAVAPFLSAQTLQKPRKACVIGHTSRGDYGNALDQALAKHPAIDLTAVADADALGLQKAKQRLKVERGYLSYAEMLEKERPEIVVIAPRHTDQHHAMAMHALKVGAHLCIERPFTTTLAEADEILALARKQNLKVAVDFQLRLQAGVQWLLQQARANAFGPLLEMVAVGKQDSRAGGEDMAVLGGNLFDMMRAFAGNPIACQAHILTGERDMTRSDATVPADNIGPVAGTSITSDFYFKQGVRGFFRSIAASPKTIKKEISQWGLILRFANERFKISADLPCLIYQYVPGDWKGTGRTDAWIVAPGAPEAVSTSDLLVDSVTPVIEDFIASIRDNRDPVTSGEDGLKSLEMIHASYWSALEEKRMHFPLRDRHHPLKEK